MAFAWYWNSGVEAVPAVSVYDVACVSCQEDLYGLFHLNYRLVGFHRTRDSHEQCLALRRMLGDD